MLKFKYVKPRFIDDPNETRKQSFLLNMFNFLVLHKFALIMLNAPEAFK